MLTSLDTCLNLKPGLFLWAVDSSSRVKTTESTLAGTVARISWPAHFQARLAAVSGTRSLRPTVAWQSRPAMSSMPTLLPLLVSRVHFWCPLLLYLIYMASQGAGKCQGSTVTHGRPTTLPHTDVEEALSSVTPTLKEISLCNVSTWEVQG